MKAACLSFRPYPEAMFEPSFSASRTPAGTALSACVARGAGRTASLSSVAIALDGDVSRGTGPAETLQDHSKFRSGDPVGTRITVGLFAKRHRSKSDYDQGALPEGATLDLSSAHAKQTGKLCRGQVAQGQVMKLIARRCPWTIKSSFPISRTASESNVRQPATRLMVSVRGERMMQADCKMH